MLGGAPGGAGLFVFEPAGVGAGLFAFRFERFEFALSDSPLRFELVPALVLRFELAFLLLVLAFAPERLAFALRLLLLAFPLSFLFVFLFRFGLFSFALADEDSFAFRFSFALPGLSLAVSEASPSFAA